MLKMVLELRGNAENDMDAIKIATKWAATGLAIADAHKCESSRAEMHTTSVGGTNRVTVKLKANVSTNSIAGNIAIEWRELSDIDAEIIVCTGTHDGSCGDDMALSCINIGRA